VAEGTVRIVHDASEFGKLRPGEVLVAPYTNPAWTPLFQRAVANLAVMSATYSKTYDGANPVALWEPAPASSLRMVR
jgi:hypothetical protein